MAVNKIIGGGINVEIDGDTTGLRNALAKASKEAQSAAAEISKSMGGALGPAKSFSTSNSLAKYMETTRKAAAAAKADFKGLENQFMGMGRAIGVALWVRRELAPSPAP